MIISKGEGLIAFIGVIMKYFLLILLSFLAACSSTNPLKMNQNAEGFNWEDNFISIMQGPSVEDRTVINFMIPKSLKYEVIVFEKIGRKVLPDAVASESTFTRDYSPWKVIEVEVSGLKTGVDYLFVVNLYNGKSSITEVREFSTLNTSDKNLKFMIASCMSDSYAYVGNLSWPSVLKNDPQFYLLIGDQVYADIYGFRYLNVAADERQLWQRYVSSRNSLALYRQQKLKPIYALWDDHDYGKNNGDKTYKYKNEAKSIFRNFFPVPNYSNINLGPGVSFSMEMGSQNFYFLDNRYFRDSNENKSGEHFGQEQTRWFFEQLNSSKQNLGHWIISGDQFFGGYHPFESFEGNHPEKFKLFLDGIRKSKKKVVFVSGDRHLVELMKIDQKEIGHQTYEFTSSGFHSHLYPGALIGSKNMRRMDGVDGRYNFAIMESKVSNENFEIFFRSMSQTNLTLLKHNLQVK